MLERINWYEALSETFFDLSLSLINNHRDFNNLQNHTVDISVDNST